MVISSATRVPGFNLCRFNRVRHPTTYLGPDEAFTMNRDSSNRFNTSPMICPTLCKAVKSSSVLLYRPTKPRTSSRIRFNRASTSRCSRILARYCSNTCSRSLNTGTAGGGGGGTSAAAGTASTSSSFSSSSSSMATSASAAFTSSSSSLFEPFLGSSSSSF